MSRTPTFVRLGYLATIQSGITVDGNRGSSPNDVTLPYLRVANVQDGRLDLSAVSEMRVSRTVARSSTLKRGDVLMTEGGDLDKLGRGTVWNDEIPNCLHQNHVFAVRPDQQKIIPEYLSLITQSSYARSYFESTGTKTTNLASTSSSKIRDFKVPLVNLDEQRRIADFLDAETARIDRLVSAISESSSLIQAKRRALLMSVFPADRRPIVRLGYYLDLVTSGPRGWGDYVGSQGTPFFRSSNLRRDEIGPNLQNLALVDPPQLAAAECTRSRIRMGDVLVGITGANTGWVSLADQRIAHANVSQHVCLVRAGPAVDGRWLAYALSAPQVQELLLGSQYGGTKTQLSLGDIRDLRVPIPSLSEQHAIVKAIADGLTAMTAERALRDQQNSLLAERRQALITAAVTGQIDVSTAGRGTIG